MKKTITKKTIALDSCTPEFIPDYVFQSNVPIILKGLVKDWPLVKAGLISPLEAKEYLKERYSGKPTLAYFGGNGVRRLGYNEDFSQLNVTSKKIDINDVLDEIFQNFNLAAPPLRYIASNIIENSFPDLIEENDLPFNQNYFKDNPLEFADPLRGIWIGTQTLSPCHYDAQSNIACCVVGTRKFTLFPPDQVENLYPGPLELNPGGPAITLVDFDDPDFQKYPNYHEAIKQGEIAELDPGDAIFIPCMWWHQVEAQSQFNVLINYWWNTFPKVRGQAMNVLYHALLSIRDRPAQEKQAWKALFDYYIFESDTKAGAHIPEQARGSLGTIDDSAARQLRSTLIQKLNR